MPSLTQGFDDFVDNFTNSSRDCYDVQPRQPPGFPLVGNGVYHPDRHAQRSRPSGVTQSGTHFSSHRSNPALPPIRDIPSWRERPDAVYSAPANGHVNGVNHGHRPNNAPYSSSRPSAYDHGHQSSHRHLHGQPSLRAEYPTYGQAEYEAAHQHASYPGSFVGVEMEYGPHSTDTSPHPSFGSLDSSNRRRRGNLPKSVTDILRAWFHEHLDHPYPSEEDKQVFIGRTGLTIQQVKQCNPRSYTPGLTQAPQISNWFINARRRQLPALRNQIRTQGHERMAGREHSPSDTEQTSSQNSSLSPQ